MEDWIDDLKIDLYKGAPPNFNDGAGPSNIPHKADSSHNSLDGAPSDDSGQLYDEIHFFDEDNFQFSVSLKPSPILFQYWEVSDNEVDFDWEKYEDCTEATKKSCRKEQGKLLCV